MTTITEQTETASNSTAGEPKATKKPRVGARVAPVATKKPKSGKKATPAKKAPKSAKQSRRRPRRQQSRQDPRPAQAAGRRNVQGTAKGQRLAAAFRTRIPFRHDRQEDGADRRFHQGRRRRAKLLDQKLTFAGILLKPLGHVRRLFLFPSLRKLHGRSGTCGSGQCPPPVASAGRSRRFRARAPTPRPSFHSIPGRYRAFAEIA